MIVEEKDPDGHNSGSQVPPIGAKPTFNRLLPEASSVAFLRSGVIYLR